MHPRPHPVRILLLLLALGCGSRNDEVPARNLVIISLDTLRADRTSLHGYERKTTPNLDRWAQEAITFTRSQSLSHETVRSHRALFQSNYPTEALRDRSLPTLAGILGANAFRTAAFTDGGPMSASFGFGRGFDLFDSDNAGLDQSMPKALAWIDEASKNPDRFYLFLHTFDLHLPYNPPAPWDTMFAADYSGSVTGLMTMNLFLGPRHTVGNGPTKGAIAMGKEDRRKVNGLYDGAIAWTDDHLSALLARLDEPDLRDNTLVVVLSDHGEEFWDHGSVLHGHTLYQELLHVPLILRVPGWHGSMRVESRVSHLDVVPTLLDLAGIPAPEALRGVSLVPLMRGRKADERSVVSESSDQDGRSAAVVLGRFKAIRALKDDTERIEVYNLDTDPREKVNLAPNRPRLTQRLLQALDDQWVDIGPPEAGPESLYTQIHAATQERLRSLGYIE